jgi:DNA-directed RNA polymerase subunit M/transcription elongation factor TFIIS
MKMFLNLVKIDPKGKGNEKEIEKDKSKIIDEEIDLTKEEEIQLKELSNGLYNVLKEECVLCGQEMISSTQKQFSQEDENIKWGKLVE